MLEIVQPSSRLRRSRNLCVVRQRAVASAVRFRRAPIVQGLSRPAQEIRETAQEGPAFAREASIAVRARPVKPRRGARALHPQQS
jgi:hypothetical protein